MRKKNSTYTLDSIVHSIERESKIYTSLVMASGGLIILFQKLINSTLVSNAFNIFTVICLVIDIFQKKDNTK